MSTVNPESRHNLSSISAVSQEESARYNAIGYDIIGAAFKVYNTTGRRFREKYYEAALA